MVLASDITLKFWILGGEQRKNHQDLTSSWTVSAESVLASSHPDQEADFLRQPEALHLL